MNIISSLAINLNFLLESLKLTKTMRWISVKNNTSHLLEQNLPQTILQSHSHQDIMALAQKYKSIEQNK